MRARIVLMGVLVALVVVAAGCGRYSFAIRRQVDRGRYGAAVSTCENQGWAATQQWNAGHRARYHVYCGLAYLNLGDSQRAASELVQAEKMRLENPRLVTGRDLAKLSQGLVRLFGVPAGQLEIEERPGQVAQTPAPTPPAVEAPPITVVPPAEAPAPPVTSAPSVSFTAGASVSGRASVTVVPPEPPEPPAPPAPPAAAIEISAPPAAAPSPPVIVIPAEDGAVIE